MKYIIIPLLLLATAADAQRSGKDYAVFFYVTDFQPGWAKLPETAGEATELKAELENSYGFTCETASNPSKAKILATLKAYNERLGENDQLLLFFSMHGHYDPSAERGFLVAADGALNDDYGDSWLSYDDLSGYLSRCKARHILLALDACHSGAFGIRNKARPEQAAFNQADDCNQRVAKTMLFNGRQYFSSGNKDAKTPAKSRFASRFLEALRKGGHEGLLRFDDLEYYLGKIDNPAPESGTFRGHVPGGDFVFVRKNGCAATPSAQESASGSENLDLLAWNTANNLKTKAAYVDYRENNCPGGTFCEAAEARLAAIANKDKSDWEVAQKNNTIEAMEKYLSEKPEGDFREAAARAIGQKKEDAAWEATEKAGTASSYRKFASDFPSAPRAKKAVQEAERLEKLKNTMASDDGMVFVPGGTFQMGCLNLGPTCIYLEEPAHPVSVSDFYIGKYEVTEQLWRNVMGKDPEYPASREHKKCDLCPVTNVSWDDVQVFLEKINQNVPAGQKPYRLPTEAEWEYAARECGKAVLFGNGKNVADPKEINFTGFNAGNYSVYGKPREKPIKVGSFKPNALGLYDMSGNVSEWCSDNFVRYEETPAIDPNIQNDPDGVRVARGGSYASTDRNIRTSWRYNLRQGHKTSEFGFRLARSK